MSRQELNAEFLATRALFKKNEIKLAELCAKMADLTAKLSELSAGVERVGKLRKRLTKLEADCHPRQLARRQSEIGLSRLHI